MRSSGPLKGNAWDLMGPAIKGLGSAGAQGNTVSIDWIVWIVGEKWRLYEGVLK
jgi:hypothetical protein